MQEGVSGSVCFFNQSDPSGPDTTAGFHYAYDFLNNGFFEVGGQRNEPMPAARPVPRPPCRPVISRPIICQQDTIHMRIIDKDGGYTDYYKTINVTNVAADAEHRLGEFQCQHRRYLQL